MRQTKHEVDVSKNIAEYVIKHGRHVSSEYKVGRRISYGRKLEVEVLSLYERNGKPIIDGNRKDILEDISANATLFDLIITLKPSRTNPIGYHACEAGLTGKFSEFSVLIGENHQDGKRWENILEANYLSRTTTGTLQKHVQRMYNRFMMYVAVALHH